MNDSTDLLLLEAWRTGDQFAGNALLSRHFQSLSRFLRNKVGSDADELIQRTLLACTESRHNFRGEATFRSYLFTVARHQLYRFFRQRAARKDDLDFDVGRLLDPTNSVVDALVKTERHAALEEALQRLASNDRLLLELFYAEGFGSRALAARFGIAPSSVRARLHRARATLKEMLGQLEPADTSRWDDAPAGANAWTPAGDASRARTDAAA